MSLDWNDRKVRELVRTKFNIDGDSPVLVDTIQRLLLAAPTDLTVLITGETGTGKEVFANAVHGLSNRSKKPFVSVNCSAIPETLLESELFGHEKGAFTGATDQRKGFFEVADGGTIFLDEIGEMPLSTQVKLLRVLESGEYSRLGSSDVRRVDVRVVAATNRKLEIEVGEGTFRRDLFYRLNSVHLVLMPLREHPEDIPILAERFARRTCEKLRIDFIGFTDDALSILKRLPWSGNIRELKNLIETMVTLEKTGRIGSEVLRSYIPPALPPYQEATQPKELAIVPINNPNNTSSTHEFEIIFRTLMDLKSDMTDLKRSMISLALKSDDLKEEVYELQKNTIAAAATPQHEVAIVSEELIPIAEMERRMIELALKKFAGNRRKAAEKLGISERTLYRKISEYGISGYDELMR